MATGVDINPRTTPFRMAAGVDINPRTATRCPQVMVQRDDSSWHHQGVGGHHPTPQVQPGGRGPAEEGAPDLQRQPRGGGAGQRGHESAPEEATEMRRDVMHAGFQGVGSIACVVRYRGSRGCGL